MSGKGKMAVRLEAIRSAAVRVAASHGLDVVEIELAGPSKERVLRVFLEKNAEGRAKLKAAIEAEGEDGTGVGELPERLIQETQAGKLKVEQLSGITHEDCAAFSRDFGVLLDVEDLVPGAEYTLEASSPGLDRKLTRPEDFQRFAGSLVKVQTFEPVRNNRHWQGRLTAVSRSQNRDLGHHRNDYARPECGQAEQQEPEGRREHGGDCAGATSRRRNWCRRFSKNREQGIGNSPAPRFLL